jgi:NTP pyrophosphatase (non-canonical NTP hydrolase)
MRIYRRYNVMNRLEEEVKQWMREKQMSGITAALYQQKACSTAIFPKETALAYLTLGLAGEAGEIANKAKKLIRDGDNPAKRAEITKELGDVCWYIAVLAQELGVNLGKVMEDNLEKLADRKSRGKLGGSGDDR